MYQKSISLNGNAAADKAAGPVFPNVLPTNSHHLQSAGRFGEPEYRLQGLPRAYTEQADIAVERQLTKRHGADRFRYLEPRPAPDLGGRHQHRRPGPVVTYNVTGSPAQSDGSFTYSTPVYVRQNRVDTRYNRINIIDAGLNSWYNGLTVS